MSNRTMPSCPVESRAPLPYEATFVNRIPKADLGKCAQLTLDIRDDDIILRGRKGKMDEGFDGVRSLQTQMLNAEPL